MGNIRHYFQGWMSVLFSLMIFVILVVVMCWASVFFYATFYTTFMPHDSISWPLHFTYESCNERPGICSFPETVVNVSDCKQGSLLTNGQSYQIVIDLEMPESNPNQNLGMFMVHSELRSKEKKLIRSSRSTMMNYKSPLLHTISTLVFFPFMMYGIHEEKQTISVDMVSSFEENTDYPLTEIYVEVSSNFIQLYRGRLHIHAVFSGLQYFIYYYPVSAAIVGVGTCMISLSFVVVFSFYYFSKTKPTPQSQPVQHNQRVY